MQKFPIQDITEFQAQVFSFFLFISNWILIPKPQDIYII